MTTKRQRAGVPHHAIGMKFRPLDGPVLASLAPRGRSWELTRHRAYQAHLAGDTVGETFGRTAAFLNLAAAGALSARVAGAHGAR